MLQMDGGFDFSSPRDVQKLRMLLNQACQTHGMTAHLLIQYLQTGLLFLSLLHNTPKTSCKIEYNEYFTSLLICMLKIYNWRTTREWDMTCCGPRCQVGFRIWHATRFEFHRPVSNCHCRVLCFEGRLICRLSLPNPFFYQWAVIFSPYFAVELWDPEQWQSHVCRRIYVHRIHMCFMWNVRYQDTPTVEHCGCKEQFPFVK